MMQFEGTLLASNLPIRLSGGAPQAPGGGHPARQDMANDTAHHRSPLLKTECRADLQKSGARVLVHQNCPRWSWACEEVCCGQRR